MSLQENIFLILIMTHFSLCFPSESCYVGNQACKIDGGNLLEMIYGVSNKEGCRDICNNTVQCNYFSYFGSHSALRMEICSTFSNCSNLYPCDDCFSENMFCNNSLACGDNIEGAIAGNLVDTAVNMNADMCKMKCKKNDTCNFYTYYDEFHPTYPKMCVLLSSLLEPFYPCQNCTTNTMDCYSDRVCGFLVDNNHTLVKIKQFKNTFTNSSVRIITVGLCKASFLVIGEGGQGASGYFHDPSGGGGSGEVSFLSRNRVNLKELSINVGGQQKASVIATSNGTTILRAKSGTSGSGGQGGNGNSGGGGAGRNGGSDGKDGETSQLSGKGDGVDISKFELQYFALTPGDGGIHNAFGCGNSGGGGGGVLINGKGPNLQSKGQGKGYGGGGSCGSVGSSGTIVIEVY